MDQPGPSPGGQSLPVRAALEEPAPRPPHAGDSGAYRPIVYQPSPVWRRIYERFFSPIQTGERWAEEIRAASERGQVVYICRSVSFLDFLALDFLTKSRGLPLIRFANDLRMSILEPFGRGARRLRLKAPVPEDQGLTESLRAGHSALLFLRQPPDALGGQRRGKELDLDLIRTIVQMQRRIERPILLCPQTLVWTKRPPVARKGPIDLLFGPSDWPGRVRTFLRFLFNYRNALCRGGEPFDVAAFLAGAQDLTDAEAADAIRYALLRRVEREQTLVAGPTQKSAARIEDELLRSPRVRGHIADAAAESGRSLAAVEAEARRDYAQLCASMDPNVVQLLKGALSYVWDRIYDGLVVDTEGLERVREAARKGPLVLLPSHKSHIDYLIVSVVMSDAGLAPPLIAAGDNLSFFPLGPILRRGGAFFIKRSFKGRRLYPKLVDAYVRKILVEGWNVELFLEGGRSRTGKLLTPKLGILSMIVDACLKLRGHRDVQVVPISIGYERIIEEGSYTRENEGGEKEPESVGGLLRAPRVLRSKYGRLYVQFGEVLPFERLLEETLAREAREVSAASPAEAVGAPGDRAAGAAAADAADASARSTTALAVVPTEITPPVRRALIQRVAHRAMYEINRATLVTPAALCATALLSFARRRGVPRSELLERARLLTTAFARLGAEVARSLRDRRGELRPDAIAEALRLFDDAGLVTAPGEKDDKKRKDPTRTEPIYVVPDERRIALEYHKNSVLHFFVPSALVSAALGGLGWDAPMPVLRERVRELSRLFKLEFMYRADAEFADVFADALGVMIEADEVVWEADRVRRAGGEGGARLGMYAGMLRSYLEGYRFTLRHARALGETATVKKDWIKQALSTGKRAWLASEIELRESVARPKLENALAALHDRGVLRLEGERIHRASAGAEIAETLERVLTESLRAE